MSGGRAALARRWRLGLLIGLILIVTLPGLLLWLSSWQTPVPTFAEVKAGWTPSEAWLLDRHGEVLHSLRQDRSVRRLDWTPLTDISPALVNAIQLAEDRRFFAHGGLDVHALAAALWQGLREGRVRGASTLSMQLAGLLDPALNNPRTGRTVLQKFRQAARRPVARLLCRHCDPCPIIGLRPSEQSLFTSEYIREQPRRQDSPQPTAGK